MNLICRLIWVSIHAFFRRRLSFFDTSIVKFRVLPNDLDLNGHMTNSRYLSIMDLGRIDLLIRSGAMKMMLSRKWKGVIGGVNLRFRLSLRPFQRYELKTRLLNVDEKWSYIEHRFEYDGQLVAYGIVRAIFISSVGSVPVPEVLKALNLPADKLPLKKFLKLWNEMEKAIKNDQQQTPNQGKKDV